MCIDKIANRDRIDKVSNRGRLLVIMKRVSFFKLFIQEVHSTILKYIDDHLSLNIPRYLAELGVHCKSAVHVCFVGVCTVTKEICRFLNIIDSQSKRPHKIRDCIRTMTSVKIQRDGKRASALWYRYLLGTLHNAY